MGDMKKTRQVVKSGYYCSVSEAKQLRSDVKIVLPICLYVLYHLYSFSFRFPILHKLYLLHVKSKKKLHGKLKKKVILNDRINAVQQK